uniref:Bifunctional enzyme IspD/IspF n=1 Tax=Anthurium amnicola TaxID=1678845 RepID=A0A1D1XUG2_9ARAE
MIESFLPCCGFFPCHMEDFATCAEDSRSDYSGRSSLLVSCQQNELMNECLKGRDTTKAYASSMGPRHKKIISGHAVTCTCSAFIFLSRCFLGLIASYFSAIKVHS